MENNKKYKIAVIVLAVLLAVQTMAVFLFRKPGVLPKHAKPHAAAKLRIAIVLDDWGYTWSNMGTLEQIKYPLTLSVLPNLQFSEQVVKEAGALGKETILHLPMEPLDAKGMEKNTILTSMDEPAILSIIDDDLKSLGEVKGVSNHMGSRATQDPRVMNIVLKDLKRRGLFFLDSFTGQSSVCQQVARKVKVRFARRDEFIDNELDPSYIRTQLNKVKSIARLYGQAVAIGHDRKNTLEVLKEEMPEMEKEGFQFVFLSDLVK